jgi:hypothetical protein
MIRGSHLDLNRARIFLVAEIWRVTTSADRMIRPAQPDSLLECLALRAVLG